MPNGRVLTVCGVGLATLAAMTCSASPKTDGGAAGSGVSGSGGAAGVGGSGNADAGADVETSTCDYLFQTYPTGATFPESDGCNTCRCDYQGSGTGLVTCSEMNCWAGTGQLPCTFGIDQTCNEDAQQPVPIGFCRLNGTCDCGNYNATSPFTGRCLRSYDDTPGAHCEYAGANYDVGTDFQCVGSCDVCHCDAPGRISRRAVACDPATGVLPCRLDGTYVYGTLGGSATTAEVSVLGGENFWYSHVSTRLSDGATNDCNPSYTPACGATNAIDQGDIMFDLMDPTVAAALGVRPGPVLFGVDTRPAGTPLTFLHRSDGGELLVGAPCAGSSGCTEISDGVTHFLADLAALDKQELAMLGCSPWPEPGTFVCDNLLCKSGSEYCAKRQANGVHIFAVCRPYPDGCTTCACVTADASSLQGTQSCPDTYFCTDAGGPVSTINCDTG